MNVIVFLAFCDKLIEQKQKTKKMITIKKGCHET